MENESKSLSADEQSSSALTESQTESESSANQSESSASADTASETSENLEAVEDPIAQLTGKNDDYVHAVTRQLMLSGQSNDEVKTILADIIPQILEAQKNGITARNLLGTPTDFVSQYKPKAKSDKAKETNKDPKLMILDSALLIFGALSLLSGALALFEKQATTYGFVTMIFASVVGGWALYKVYTYQESDQKKSHAMLRTMGVMLVWIVFTLGSCLLPTLINPHLPSVVLLILGVVVLVIRWLLKRRFHIQSTMVPRQPQQQAPKKKKS